MKEIELPDGSIAEFPDAMPDSQIERVLREQFGPKQASDPTAGMSTTDKALAGAGKAFVDVGRGVEQFVRGIAPGESDRERELQTEINESRRLDAPLMNTGAGLAGNIAGNVAMFAPTAAIPGANTYTGAAALGSVLGGTAPVAEGESRGMNTGIGLLGGAGGRALTGGIGRMLSPRTDPAAVMMRAEGVPMTPGQMLGGAFKRTEDKITSVPLLGDMVSKAQTRSIEGFNKAAINKVLAPIGQKVEKIGHEGVREAYEKVTAQYQRLLPGLTAQTDDTFAADMRSIAATAGRMKEANQKQFASILKADVIRKIGADGKLTGKTFKQIDSEIGRLASNARGSANMDDRMLADALGDTQFALREMFARSNPAEAATLRQIDKAYSRLIKIEDAAGRAGSKEGVFTPATLRAAVKKSDKSLRDRRFSHGTVDIQDFAEAAERTLPQKVPNSGTFDRFALPALGGAAAAGIDPLVVGGTGLLASAYTRPGAALMRGLLASRPGVMRSAGNAALDRAALGSIGGAGGLIGYSGQ